MIKKTLRAIVVAILQLEARLVLKKYQPKIIGVTGSVGKTSTKDAIYEVIKGEISAGRSDKSYNSADFGVALTILGSQSAWQNIFGWLEVMINGLSLILISHPYPKWLVLEIGLEHPGEIARIVKWIKFDLVVITFLPEVPVHVEFFKSKEEVIKEKWLLAETVPPGGKVFVNFEDENAKPQLAHIMAESLTYGLNPAADYAAEHVHIFYEEKNGRSVPQGLVFKLQHNGKSLPVKINGVIGEHQIYPILAALAVGDNLDLNMITMIEAIGRYVPPPGRLRLIEGIKNSTILDDSYNASPVAVTAAIKTLAKLEITGRRIAVLGDMLQLGDYTPEAHRAVGELCAEICDLVVTVGLRTKFIDEVLREKKFPVKKMAHFDEALAAGQYLQNIIKAGDVILVKGSQALRLEKTVAEIMAHPEDKAKLLARQEKEWQNR